MENLDKSLILSENDIEKSVVSKTQGTAEDIAPNDENIDFVSENETAHIENINNTDAENIPVYNSTENSAGENQISVDLESLNSESIENHKFQESENKIAESISVEECENEKNGENEKNNKSEGNTTEMYKDLGVDEEIAQLLNKIPDEDISPEEIIDILEKEVLEEKETDEAPDIPEIIVTENIDDSQELADEVGVSGIFDSYGREILEPVFENRLRMSRNGVKLAYSKIKNTILAYKDMKQRFARDYETFRHGEKLLFKIELGENSVFLYCALDAENLDKEKYGFTAAKGNEYKDTPVKLIVKREKEKKQGTLSSIEKALALIELVMGNEKIEKRTVYVPVAYAERYPLNPFAVLRGKENNEPVEGCYDGEEYEPIDDEISRNIIIELMGKDHSIEDKTGRERLEAMRQQATTIKGAIAMTEPIVYFYDCAVNNDNTPAYINVQQVLNDKFMGKIIPQQFFAIAESSERITELNLLTLKQVVEDCNANPKIPFVTKISTKLIAKKTGFNKLLKAIEIENKNLILAFDCSLLEALGQISLDALNALKQKDVRIMIDDTENAGLKVLTEYPIDYLRFDSRYYQEDNKATVAHLDMLTGYAKIQGIMATSNYVDNTKMARFLQTHGIEQIQGPVVCEPKRLVNTAIRNLKKLPTFSR